MRLNVELWKKKFKIMSLKYFEKQSKAVKIEFI